MSMIIPNVQSNKSGLSSFFFTLESVNFSILMATSGGIFVSTMNPNYSLLSVEHLTFELMMPDYQLIRLLLEELSAYIFSVKILSLSIFFNIHISQLFRCDNYFESI